MDRFSLEVVCLGRYCRLEAADPLFVALSMVTLATAVSVLVHQVSLVSVAMVSVLFLDFFQEREHQESL